MKNIYLNGSNNTGRSYTTELKNTELFFFYKQNAPGTENNPHKSKRENCAPNGL